MLNVHLICIDDQVDFTDPNGSLFVKGGDENVRRLAKMIKRLTPKLTEIHLTMDSHRIMDISHPTWWVDENGKPPAAFTRIEPDGDGFTFVLGSSRTKGHPRIMSFRDRSMKYLKALNADGRYPHVIWPEHCLIGDQGHNINPVLADAVHHWERTRLAAPDVVTKGSNPWTEHFSAVQAEVPDPSDPSTQINRQLVQTLEQADIVLWAGEALSHCLANTFRDTIANFSDPAVIAKMVLLTDASSSVSGFEHLGDAFVKDMIARGMKTSTTVDILA